MSTWDDYARNAELARRDKRRRALEAEHGKPVRAGTALVIEALARLARQDVDPAKVYGYVYRDQAAASAWQASTLRYNRVPSLGTVPVDGGILGLYDLR